MRALKMVQFGMQSKSRFFTRNDNDDDDDDKNPIFKWFHIVRKSNRNFMNHANGNKTNAFSFQSQKLSPIRFNSSA